MNQLQKYSTIAFTIVFLEVVLIYIYKPSLIRVSSVPETFEGLNSNNTLAASLSPSLPVIRNLNSQEQRETVRVSVSIEAKIIKAGLINIKEIDSTLAVFLKYATTDNFLHKNMYGDLKNCYLQKDVAHKLANAQRLLKQKFPFYSLIVYDCARPTSIQKLMWDEIQVPAHLKDKYVSNPDVGSLHNYGCAVDLSIINENGWEMDMGTPYDFFGELAHPIAEERMLKEGKLTWRQLENRKLLREVMVKSGFTTITTEWWHFNGSSLKIAGERYHKLD